VSPPPDVIVAGSEAAAVAGERPLDLIAPPSDLAVFAGGEMWEGTRIATNIRHHHHEREEGCMDAVGSPVTAPRP
jgi:hypothetical protein